MEWYTKQEARPLISPDLKADTLDYWIAKLAHEFKYDFLKEIPTRPTRFVRGKPMKKLVFDADDLARFQRLYERRRTGVDLGVVMFDIFLAEADKEKYLRGDL
jgi:hypothetical protein